VNEPASQDSALNDYGLDDGFSITGRNRADSASKPAGTVRILLQNRQELSKYCFSIDKNRTNSVSKPAGTERILFQNRQEPSEYCFSIDKNRANSVSAPTRNE